MTKFGFGIIVATVLLYAFVHGNRRPRCDSNSYGQPDSFSCKELILDEIPDNLVSRYFSLVTTVKPDGIKTRQFAMRVALPYLRENDGCKMAFLAIRFINGSISSDTSRWLNIRDETLRLNRLCGAFATAPTGGNLVVGDYPRLAMILYAPGSVFDDTVKQQIAAGVVVVADEDDEPELGATINLVKPNSLACKGERLLLNNSTSCNATKETVNSS